jgi:zinc transporter ZupT
VNFLQDVFVHVAGNNPVLQGLVGGTVIAFLNMLGALGFAAGAMIYVISDEIIPQTHTKGYERIATLGERFSG